MKIGQLEGLPSKKSYTQWETNTPDGLYNKGFNECKDICDGIEIEMNVEEIAKSAYHKSQIIDKNDVFKTKWEDLTDIWKKPWLSMAEAIANNIERIVRRKK